MKLSVILALLFSLLLLGCYSSQNLGTGGEAPLITTSKNFTMKQGWQENFRLVSGSSTITYTVTVTNIASKAAKLRITSGTTEKSIPPLPIGNTETISLNGTTIFITLNDVSEGYARFSISLSQQGTPPVTPPVQPGEQPKVQNGGKCSNSSVCQSGYCSNGYCCSSGSCCISDSNCSIGKCNMTTYSCFTVTLLSNGSPCTSNADCQSNHCNNSYCCASGKCCLSNSNCASGEVCNTTTFSCVQAAPTYAAADAEAVANSTTNGTLMSRFSSIFNAARECAGGSVAYKQCVPAVTVRDDKVSTSTYRVIYSYYFNGTSCCPTTDVLVITVNLSANTTTTQWIDTTITSTLADSMDSAISSNCVSALQYIACKIS